MRDLTGPWYRFTIITVLVRSLATHSGRAPKRSCLRGPTSEAPRINTLGRSALGRVPSKMLEAEMPWGSMG